MEEQEQKRPKTRIPRFRSREEEAEFWDTQDSAEFDWRPVRMKVAERIHHVLSIQIERDVLTRLIDTSRARSVGLDELVARLISEELGRMGAEPASASSRKGKRRD